MLRTTALGAAAAIVVLAALPSAARAQDASVAGKFHWSSDVDGGSRDGTLTIAPAPSGYTVQASEKRKSGDVAWTGSASLDGSTLTIERAEGSVGLAGAVAGASVTSSLEYVAVFDKDLDHAAVTVYRKDASGKATEIGRGALEDHVPFWEKQPGDLLALEEKQVSKALHKEIDLDESFHVKDYTSLGIKAGAKLLADGERSDFMKESDRCFRLADKGEPIWIHTVVAGGPVVSWGHTIPLGHVSLSAGFSAGATLTYTCDDQHARPDGLDDVQALAKLAESIPAQAFVLPATADRALSLPEGTRRGLEGQGSLALSGGAAFGYRLRDLGALTNVTEVGIDAGFAVHWGISGDLRLEFERQDGTNVHLRWTKGAAMTAGAEVNALLGLYVSGTLEDKIPHLVKGPVVGVVQKGESYTCVQFNASKEWLDSKELVIDLGFDLSDAAARVAFEAAVLGDLRPVQALAAASSHAGLRSERIQTTLTDDLTYSVHFSAFQVLGYDRATDTKDVHIDVESLDGTHSATDVYSYAKRVHGFFAHLFGGGDRSLGASASNRTVVSPNGSEAQGQQVAFTFDQTIDHVSHETIDEELLMASSLFGPDAIAHDVEAVHGQKKVSGKAQLHLDVTFGSEAIATALAAGDEAFLEAYGRAPAHGEATHAWDAARIEGLRHVSLIMKDDATDAEEALRLEAWDLHDAEEVTRLLDKARASSNDRASQVKQFREIAKKAGFKLRALIALVGVAGQGDTHVAMSLKAKNLDFEHAAGQASALPGSN